MGLKEALRGKRVYFDTNIFIYLLEGNKSFENPISCIRELIEDEDIFIVSCDLTYTEMLPIHARNEDEAAMNHILKFLSEFEMVGLSRKLMIQAGILRGELGMKTPDTIHVVSAIESECDVFLTNDDGIRVPKGMQRIIISDYV